jgi:hypothetical protein
MTQITHTEMITPVLFEQFRQDWYRGLHPHLRLGQAFLNGISNVSDPKIYYEEDPEKAAAMIREKYVDYTKY